jgi:transposase
MMKIDALKLTAVGRRILREQVIRLHTQSGLTRKALAAIAGVHVRTVEVWVGRASRESDASLAETRRGRPLGSCRKLRLADEQWLREQIIGGNPRQRSLPFALWTRPAIRALIRERFALEVSDRLVGKYLGRWGFTPQRPVTCALEQDPTKLAWWLSAEYPALQRAKAQGAVILWGDESAVKEDIHWVRGDAPRGHTPVLKTRACWDTLSMISAISARGEVAFQILQGSVNAECFLAFLAALLDGRTQKVLLVVDNLRVHRARLVTQWLADKAARIELVFLPP